MMGKEHFWGVELNKSKITHKWSPDADDNDDAGIEQVLQLKQAVLGAKATKGERNIIEVTTKDYKGKSVKQPIVSLELGKLEVCPVHMNFNPPVTFKLTSGSGPVHLTGNHLMEVEDLGDSTLFDEMGDEEDEEEEEEEEDEDDDEEEEISSPEKNDASPVLAKSKKRPASTPVETSKKVPKLEYGKATEDGSDEDSDDEESDDESDEIADFKLPGELEMRLQKEAAAAKAEEEEDDEDDEDDSDFEVDSEDEDDESDESDEDSDDEDDEDDEDEDEDDEEDEEEESEEEVVKKKDKKEDKSKRKTQINGETTKDTPKASGKRDNKGKEKELAKDKDKTKTPAKKEDKGKATPNDKTPASSKKPKFTSIDEIKADIAKSPALPKKEPKFENWVRNKYKVEDKQKIKDLWSWHQKTNLKS